MQPHTRNYSVVDPIQPTLDPQIINKNENNKLNVEVRNKLLGAVKRVEKAIGIKIQKTWILGSSLTFQYTEDSDIDMTLFVNKNEDELKELNRYSTKHFNEKIYIADHPVNFYFTSGRFFKFKADAIYDLEADKWIKKPEAMNEDEVEKIIEGCQNVKEFNEILQEYSDLKNMLESFSGEDGQLEEIMNQTIKVGNLFNKIRDVRRDEFDKRQHGDIPSANFRCSNIIFKLLENYGLADLATEVAEFLDRRLKN